MTLQSAGEEYFVALLQIQTFPLAHVARDKGREKIPGDVVAQTVLRQRWTSMVVTRAQIHKQPSETEMSDSSSVPSRGQVTKLTKKGRVPARHFMDALKEDYMEATLPWRKGAIICAIVTMVLLAIVALGAYVAIRKPDVAKDFTDFNMQKMAELQDMWSNMHVAKDFTDYILQKKAELKNMWENMNLGIGEKTKKKKYMVTITKI